MFSEKGKPLKLALVREGDYVRGYSLMTKSKRLAKILMAIVHAKRSQKKLKLLQNFLIIINGILTPSTGFRIAVNRSLSYI